MHRHPNVDKITIKRRQLTYAKEVWKISVCSRELQVI
jgi:hypothetical protein